MSTNRKANNIVMYAENERKEATITYGKGVNINVNHEKRTHIKEGDTVTLLGEFELAVTGMNTGDIIKQYIFTFEGVIFSIAQHFATIIPEEKLEAGDFVRIKWSALGMETYLVKKSRQRGHIVYNLINILNANTAFNEVSDTSELLKTIKEHSGVLSYEILPKAKYKVSIVEKDSPKVDTDDFVF